MRLRVGSPIFVLLALPVLAGCYLVWAWLFHHASLPEGLIQANGRIEGDHITVSSKFSGRIRTLAVQEGDVVKAGQTLIVLDDVQVRTRVTQAAQGVETLKARVEALRMDVDVLRKEVPLQIGTAEAEAARERALSAKAGANGEQARKDALRLRQLVAQGADSLEKGEHRELALTAAESDLAASRASVVRAEKQLAQANLGWERIKVKEGELKALEAQLEQSGAALAEAESVLSDFVIKAPADGVILTRIADVGEMASPGAPLFDMVDQDRLYLKVFAPEATIGKVRLGLAARIYTDSFPGRAFPATVRAISSRAEFTPKEVQTPDERTKLVYAVKLYLDENPDHSLTPGMPADAVIRWKEGAAWAMPRW